LLQNPSKIKCGLYEQYKIYSQKAFQEYRGNIRKTKLMSKSMNVRHVYRGINKFKRSYQHRSNLVKNGNGDLRRFPQYFK
jgi:hypothetical protein